MFVFLVAALFLETGILQRSRIGRTGRNQVVSESIENNGYVIMMFGPLSKFVLFSHTHRVIRLFFPKC